MTTFNKHWKPGRWYRVTSPDGTVWCETSDRDEALEALATARDLVPNKPYFLERQFVKNEAQWVDIGF